VLEMLGEVYRYDAEARNGALTAAEGLRFHQEHSGPVMEKLHGWLEAQFAERKAEPNSGLGKAITYLLRHWKALTMFLREAGAPLDNNLCERALKRAVLHRKLCVPRDYAEYLTRRCNDSTLVGTIRCA
jgi:transposase